MKVVLDTNVLISMLLWGKSLKQLFNMINRRQVILCFSHETIDELFRVIHYPQMQSQGEKLNINVASLTDKLLAASVICYPDSKVNVIKDDSDNRLLEVALAGKAKCIISGDKHLLRLGNFKNIPIYNPAKSLELFAKIKGV